MSCSPNPGKERSRSRSPIRMKSPDPKQSVEFEGLSPNLEQKTLPEMPTVPEPLSNVMETNEYPITTKLQESLNDESENDSFHSELLRLEESIKEETSMIDEVLNDEISESFQQKTPSKQNKDSVRNQIIHLSNFPKQWDFHEIRNFLHKNTSLSPAQKVFIDVTKDTKFRKMGECDVKFKSIEVCMQIYTDLVNLIKTKDSFRHYRVKIAEVNPENINEKKKKVPVPKVVPVANFPPTFLPVEVLTNDTYGISLQYLTSLGIKPPITHHVFVDNLDHMVDEAKLREVFELAGQVKKINLFRPRTKQFKARITYDHPIEVVQAVAMLNNQFLYNLQMKVTMDTRIRNQRLPVGLSGVGKGLGPNGFPLRGVRAVAEIRPLKELINEMRTKNLSHVPVPPADTFPYNNPIAPNVTDNNQNNETNSLNPQNLLLGLLGAQGLFQQGIGNNNMMAMLANMQNQNTASTNQFMNPWLNVPQTSPSIVQNTLPQNPFNAGTGWNGQQNQNLNQNATDLNQTAGGYNQHAGGSNQHAGGSNQHAGGSNQNVAGYNQNMAGYNQNMTGYNQNMTGYNQNMAGYNQNMVGYNQNETQIPKESTTPFGTGIQQSLCAEPVFYNQSQTNRGSADTSLKKGNKTASSSSSKIANKPEKEPSDLLVFSNLPPSVTVQALNVKMREVGDLMFTEMTSKGRAIVRFKYLRDAERCIKLFNQSRVDGQVIEVQIDLSATVESSTFNFEQYIAQTCSHGPNSGIMDSPDWRKEA